MAELGIANVVGGGQPSSTRWIEKICQRLRRLHQDCQFNALSMDDMLASVNIVPLCGCGVVCVLACSAGALGLVRRPEEEVKPVPQTQAEWECNAPRARVINFEIEPAY